MAETIDICNRVNLATTSSLRDPVNGDSSPVCPDGAQSNWLEPFFFLSHIVHVLLVRGRGNLNEHRGQRKLIQQP